MKTCHFMVLTLVVASLMGSPRAFAIGDFDNAKDESKFNHCTIHLLELPESKSITRSPRKPFVIRGRIDRSALPKGHDVILIVKLFDDAGVEITGKTPKPDKEGRYEVEIPALGDELAPELFWICVYVIDVDPVFSNDKKLVLLGQDPANNRRPYDVQPLYLSNDPSTQPKDSGKPTWMKQAEEADAKVKK